LSGGVRVIELERIGPHDGRQALTLFVVSGKVERERELNSISPFVRYKLFGNATQLRRGIGEIRERLFASAIRGTDEIIGRFRWALMTSDELRSVVGHQRYYRFILAVLALKN